MKNDCQKGSDKEGLIAPSTPSKNILQIMPDWRKEKRKRTMAVRIRLTPAEKDEFEKRSSESHLSIPDYIRVKCLQGKPLRKARKIDLNREMLHSLIIELRAVGNLLNQQVKKLHTLGEMYSSDQLMSQETLAQLKSLINQIHLTLGYHDPSRQPD